MTLPGAGGSATPDPRWGPTRRYDRWAEVTRREAVTPTGTVRISAQVTDERPFDFMPGQFVAIELEVAGLGFRHNPYCLLTGSSEERTFDLLVRVVGDGSLSQHVGALRTGDPIGFRSPYGRSMVPKEDGTELVLLATGVGVGPFHCLARHLRDSGDDRPVHLYWGLRLADDICLTDELEELAESHPRFSYDISLSQPPPGWTGLSGRLTESVPPLLDTLGGKHFYLCGNGAMIEDFSSALSDLGVEKRLIHTEAYFNARHRSAPQTVAAIRDRFVANDLFSPFTDQQGGWFERGMKAMEK